MTKEYIGEAFRAPYCEALAKGDVEWQHKKFGVWVEHNDYHIPVFSTNACFRFKPAPKRMVTMYTKDGPVELVAPEREAPNDMCSYIDAQGLTPPVYPVSNSWFLELLRAGNVFLTHEDAQAMADFQRKQRLGEV